MKNRGWRVATGVAAVLIVGFSLHWFFNHFERRERQVRNEVSAQARRNPLLAAERFLNRLGREVQSVSGRNRLLRLPPVGDALLVNRFSTNLPPDREEALVNWLREGGHLIIAAAQAWDEDTETSGNHLLDRFGVRLQTGDGCGCRGEAGDDTSQGATPPEQNGRESRGTVAVHFAGRDKPLWVGFDRYRVLQDAGGQADWAVGSKGRFHLLQYKVGAGRLTVLSDHRFLHNERIGDRDHALFLALLMEEANKVWLLYSSQMPSLFTLLWRHQPGLMLSGLALASLWLWYLTGFTGPRHAPAARRRRNILEHLDAAASFAWRVDHGQRLLAETREAIGREWTKRHHPLAWMEKRARCAWIAERNGLAPRAVESALYGEARSEQDFVRISSVQQKLLAMLNKHKE
jgi:hypothetical protein